MLVFDRKTTRPAPSVMMCNAKEWYCGGKRFLVRVDVVCSNQAQEVVVTRRRRRWEGPCATTRLALAIDSALLRDLLLLIPKLAGLFEAIKCQG